MGKIKCDLCGHEIIAHVTHSNTDIYNIDSSGKPTVKSGDKATDFSKKQLKDTTFYCGNPDCRQLIGDAQDLKFYKGNSDPDEFRLFKQLDRLQDVIEELCRMQLHTNSLDASVVIRNTLKDLPQKLPVIIEMQRKMVEGDFIESIDLKSIFTDLDKDTL